MTDLRLQELTKAFGSATLLDSLDLEVPAGAYLVLLGASGSGKTTTLKLIAGLLQPDRGEIHIGGRDVTGTAARQRGVSMVFQNDSLYPHLSVRRSLTFGIRGLNRAERHRRVDQAAELTGIGPLLERLPARLSGGELRRAAVAKAIVRRAPLRLFDEPLSALDPPVRDSLQRDLVGLHQTLGGTTIHVTHDGYEAMRMADRIAVLDRGRILQCAAPAELYARPAHRAVARAIGTPPINLIPAGTDADADPVPWGEIRFGQAAGRRPLELGVRAESFRPIGRGDEGSSDRAAAVQWRPEGLVIQGEVQRSQPVGPTRHVEVQVAGAVVTAAISPHEPIESGRWCRLAAPSGAVTLFDTVSGRRIGVAPAA